MDAVLFFTGEIICPDQGRVRAMLDEWGVDYREINVTRDAAAEAQVRAWLLGALRLPVLAVCSADAAGATTLRGLVAEPSTATLHRFLTHYGCLPAVE